MHDTASRRERAAALRGIYAVVEPERRALPAYVRELLAGGVRLFQVRAKRGIERDALNAIVTLVRAAGGITIVNDDIEAASAADGLHLGQEDAAAVDLRSVRRRLGGALIGLSCGTPDEARAADPNLVDYLGVGPIFATGTKADAGLPIGVSGVRAVVQATRFPVAAIGGIDVSQLGRVRETGAAMAAIVSALSGAVDARAVARDLVAAWNR